MSAILAGQGLAHLQDLCLDIEALSSQGMNQAPPLLLPVRGQDNRANRPRHRRALILTVRNIRKQLNSFNKP